MLGDEVTAGERKKRSVQSRLLSARGLLVGAMGLFLLGVWQLVSVWKPLEVASPGGTVSQFWAWASDNVLWTNSWTTLQEVLIGSVLAFVIGVPLGLLLASSSVFDKATRPYIDIANTIPRMGLAPLFVLWFGLGLEPKIVLVFSVLVFVVMINIYTGVKNVDEELVLLVRLLGGNRRDVARKVITPSLVPWFIATLRLGAAYAIASAVIGEFIAGNSGLGYLLSYNTQIINVKGEFAALMALAILAAILTIFVMLFERRMLRWQAPRGGRGSGLNSGIEL
ncbi:MAG: ABC transporter permease subunit [Acidimicrobiales bacterium]|jgi:NitT/TauT family transport system permease protein